MLDQRQVKADEIDQAQPDLHHAEQLAGTEVSGAVQQLGVGHRWAWPCRLGSHSGACLNRSGPESAKAPSAARAPESSRST